MLCSLANAAHRRHARILVIALSVLVVFAPLTAQTSSPASVAIKGGAICTGGSKSFDVSVALPSAAVTDKVDVFFLFVSGDFRHSPRRLRGSDRQAASADGLALRRDAAAWPLAHRLERDHAEDTKRNPPLTGSVKAAGGPSPL